MTTEEKIHVFEHSKLVSGNFTQEAVTAAYVEALAALRAKQEAEKNDPLTLDELREMDGEPVWVKPLVGWKTEPFWAIVHGRDVSDGRLSNDPERCVLSLGDPGAYWTDWLAYRRKPEEV